ncbi:hypothetical protein B296_00038968, partial [Ensete ventricosum]
IADVDGEPDLVLHLYLHHHRLVYSHRLFDDVDRLLSAVSEFEPHTLQLEELGPTWTGVRLRLGQRVVTSHKATNGGGREWRRASYRQRRGESSSPATTG